MAEGKKSGGVDEHFAKLWAAYKRQEDELSRAKRRIRELEKELEGRERINKSLKRVLEARDKEIRDLELKVEDLKQRAQEFQPEMEELDERLRAEKERYAKLFAIAEELEAELLHERREVEARDDWFRTHMGVFADIQQAIRDRMKMIERIRKASTVETDTKKVFQVLKEEHGPEEVVIPVKETEPHAAPHAAGENRGGDESMESHTEEIERKIEALYADEDDW